MGLNAVHTKEVKLMVLTYELPNPPTTVMDAAQILVLLHNF